MKIHSELTGKSKNIYIDAYADTINKLGWLSKCTYSPRDKFNDRSASKTYSLYITHIKTNDNMHTIIA